MNHYQKRQEEIREQAIEFQCALFAHDLDDDPDRVCELQEYFRKYGKRYGLLREFRENCVI